MSRVRYEPTTPARRAAFPLNELITTVVLMVLMIVGVFVALFFAPALGIGQGKAVALVIFGVPLGYLLLVWATSIVAMLFERLRREPPPT